MASGSTSKDYTELDNLVKGKAYRVLNFTFRTTKYGQQVMVHLNDEVNDEQLSVFLPQRIASTITTDEDLLALKEQNYYLLFRGRDPKRKNMALLDFITNLNSQKHL